VLMTEATAIAAGDRLCQIDLRTGDCVGFVAHPSGTSDAICRISEHQFLAGVSQSPFIQIWDLRVGRLLPAFPSPFLCGCTAIAVDKMSKRLVLGSEGGNVHLVRCTSDFQAINRSPLRTHSSRVCGVRIDQDRIIASSVGGDIHLYDFVY